MSDNDDSILGMLQPRSKVASLEKVEGSINDDPDVNDYVAFGQGRVGRRPSMMVAFRKASGKIEVFPYSMLRRIQTDDPERGFRLSFGETEITIKGRELGQLFRYVCEHRAVEMVEADRAEAFDDASCLITEISVQTR